MPGQTYLVYRPKPNIGSQFPLIDLEAEMLIRAKRETESSLKNANNE